ncbi:MAG TPA: D-aminoacylase [bacterium]
MYDLVIRGAEVLDGTGSPAQRVDVAVEQGRIAAIGNLHGAAGRETVDAGGLTLTPGFIDLHSHDDFNLPVNPLQPGKVLQGVTTDVVGNCGFSPAPLSPERRKEQIAGWGLFDSGLDPRWATFGEFLDAMPPTGPNVVPLVGHGAIRAATMGGENRAPTDAELDRMRDYVDEAMRAGSFGLSTGLVYAPGSYAKTDEVIALAKVSARHGGGYFTHMRDEGTHVLDSIRETLTIGRQSGAHVQISHLKLADHAMWGNAREALALIDAARKDGLRVHADQYPYTAGSTLLRQIMPAWSMTGGLAAIQQRLQDPSMRAKVRDDVLGNRGAGSFNLRNLAEDVLVAQSATHPEFSGLSLQAIAERVDRQPVEALLDLLGQDDFKTLAIFFLMGEDDVRTIMRHPAVGIGSDGIYTGVPGKPDPTKPHPRYFGTFPRVIGHYAREQGVLSLPQAIHKMTGLAAEALGLRQRGTIAPGQAADLVLFDAATIIDKATYIDPHQTPAGITRVVVGGTTVAMDGKMTGAAPGTVLRRGRA